MKKITKNNFYILTGGPGAGKSSVLEELHKLKHQTVPETARAIIKVQEATNGSATHTGNRKAFRDLMLESSITDFLNYQNTTKPIFFDRGIPDLYGYSKEFCEDIPENVITAVNNYRYNQTVFLFPPWEEIYQNDSERKQNFSEALVTYEAIKNAYLKCKYNLIEIPKTTISKRAKFI